MKSSSDHYPEAIVMSNGKTQIRFNTTKVIRTMMDKETESYDYDYVEIVGEVTKAKIREAIILSGSAETVLANDVSTNLGTPEYEAYQEAMMDVAAKVVVEAAKAQAITDNLPSRQVMLTAIDKVAKDVTDATTLALVKPAILALVVIVKKMGQVVYWLATNKAD